MNPNDTPETDAEWHATLDWCNKRNESHDPHHASLANLCEKLERERNANQAMIDKLKIQLTAALDTVAKLEREKQ